MNAECAAYLNLVHNDTLDDLSEEEKNSFEFEEANLRLVSVPKLVHKVGLAPSVSAASRLVKQNAVRINNGVVEDFTELVPLQFVLRVGKRMLKVSLKG